MCVCNSVKYKSNKGIVVVVLLLLRCQCVSGHVVRAGLSYRGSLRKQKFVSGVKTQGG